MSVTTSQKNPATQGDLSPCICCLEDMPVPYHAGLIRCRKCGHVHADLSWTPEQFRNLYTTDYFKGGEYADYEEEETALRLNFQRRVRELADRHPKNSSLWEIGCAYGFFLKEASTHFSAAGCDVAEGAVRCAVEKKGVQARYLDYLGYTPEEPFDIICLWDVIEHLPEPGKFLEKAYNDLRPGGTLALSTGDIASLCARLRGSHWRQIHPPTHVHYFTRQSMNTLLTRLGYTDISFHYYAFWRNLDTVAEKLLSEHPVTKPLYQVLHRYHLLHLNFPLNLYDLMTVYARKPE
ncbi:MAG: class I SAM-dependent methyltransferase [Candidatus Hydrogenedentes bacterium]|nr:class I SAM-dependent methyltransferase [Candidatus Hydrogenedentota bacterium]